MAAPVFIKPDKATRKANTTTTDNNNNNTNNKKRSRSQIKFQKRIEEIVGGSVTWGFEGNMEAFREDIGMKNWEEMGNTVTQYCAAICDMLVRDCEDEEIKEIFIDTFYSRKIVFKYDQRRTIKFPKTELANGCLKIIFAPKCFNIGPNYITCEGNSLKWIM